MKNKVKASVLGFIGLLFAYFTYNQYVHVKLAKEAYVMTGNQIPTEFNSSVILVLVITLVSFFFSIRFFLKK